MVVIRLSRGGSNKTPFYRIVVADRRKPRDGRYIEHVGYFNPVARGKDLRLKLEGERIQYWLSQGAKATPRVASLIESMSLNPEKAQAGGPTKGEAKRLQSETDLRNKKIADLATNASTEATDAPADAE